MKIFNKFSILCLMVLMTLCFGQTAFAAKTLGLGTASINNTGDDAARTATLDVTLAGGANDVNGLVFTLVYNKDVFTFEGLEQSGMPIDDGADYDPENPPAAATIAATLYYQTNNKPAEGIVMIAAAAANFFTDNAPATFVPFKAKFKVNTGIGNGRYPIGIQKTIIGPDTAANAGYTQPTALDVAAGLDPNNDPTTAQTYDVLFSPGLITVLGGYDVAGTAVYGSTPETFADGAVVNLIQVLASGEFKVGSQIVKDGEYTFAKVPNGTFRVELFSTRPGYQKRFLSPAFDVAGADVVVDKITLSQYEAKSGSIMINGSTQNLSGLRIEVRDGDTVIGSAVLDASGNYVTPPLPSPLPGTVSIWAVYGNTQVDITQDPAYDWTLSLGTVSGTITGLCDDQMVEVFIRSETTRLQKAVMVTGAAGSNPYTLTNLLAGTDYVLSVVGEGVGLVYFDGTEEFDSATPVSVTANADTPDQDFAFTCGDLMTISGTVTVDGTAVSGVQVRATNFDFADWKIGTAQTAANGTFEIKVAKSDDYYVYFEHTNGQSYYYKDDAGTPAAVTMRSEASQVDVSVSDATDINIPVLIPVPDTAGLEGYVSLNRSIDNGGIPLKNYLLALFTADNIPLPFTARTNEDGYYLFANMPPGTYNVGLLPPPPYARQSQKGVVLENGSTAAASFIVDQNFKVTGLVQEADGNAPIQSARVDIVKSDGQKLRSATYTDALGSYTLFDIPSGVYTLVASHKDYFPESQEETVSSDTTATTILMTKGSIIEGVVSDTNGVVANAIVTLRGLTYVKSTRTNSLGAYQFRGLEASSPHMIKVSKGTMYVPYEPEVVDTGAAGTTVTHDMTLVIPLTTWTFGGTVTEDGTPVSKAYVLLFSTTTKYQKVVQTSASGGFTFTTVIEGTDYSLLVLPGDGKPVIKINNISITADTTDYAVAVPTLAVISGTITLSEAGATAFVIAGAYDPATGAVHEVRTSNPSGDHQTFTYSIKVKAGVAYKVFAQDLTGTFPLQYWVSTGVSGTYAQAGDVTNTTADVDISLTKP